MKTNALAPIVVEILVGRRSVHKIEADSGIKLLIIWIISINKMFLIEKNQPTKKQKSAYKIALSYENNIQIFINNFPLYCSTHKIQAL
jgi:hypothetical protein